MLGDGAEVGVDGVALGPGVADLDYRASFELILRKAAVLEEGPIVEPHLVLPAEPGLAAKLLLVTHAGLSCQMMSGVRRPGLIVQCQPSFSRAVGDRCGSGGVPKTRDATAGRSMHRH